MVCECMCAVGQASHRKKVCRKKKIPLWTGCFTSTSYRSMSLYHSPFVNKSDENVNHTATKCTVLYFCGMFHLLTVWTHNSYVQLTEFNKEVKLWSSYRLLHTKCFCTPHWMVLLQMFKDVQRVVCERACLCVCASMLEGNTVNSDIIPPWKNPVNKHQTGCRF